MSERGKEREKAFLESSGLDHEGRRVGKVFFPGQQSAKGPVMPVFRVIIQTRAVPGRLSLESSAGDISHQVNSNSRISARNHCYPHQVTRLGKSQAKRCFVAAHYNIIGKRVGCFKPR